jgi:DNA polymerase
MGGDHDRIGMTEAASTLAWWLEAGVDIAIAEEPRNWLKPKSEQPRLAERKPFPAAEQCGAKRVLPHGFEAAPVMLIAEMPSGEDAAEGRPIAGAAWQLTERMLAAIGIDAADAYSATLSCFHSPGPRMTPQELEQCATIARRHVTAAKPQRILLLGDGPALALLGKRLVQARGHVHKIEGVRAVATFHPRHLLNRPSDKALAWKDLLLMMEEEA